MAEQSQHLATEEALSKDIQEFHLTTIQLEVLPFPTISVSMQDSEVSFVLILDSADSIDRASFFISSFPYYICIVGCLPATPPSVLSL